jgi:hypothetical protein
MENNGEEPSQPANAETTPAPEPAIASSNNDAGNGPGTNSKRWLWQGKIGPAFWTVACLISLTFNLILIVAVLILAKQVFGVKGLIEKQLIGGLYNNFVLMDDARITTTVQVHDEIPVRFDLPVVTETTVTLTENTRIKGVRINLRTGGLSITDAPANIVLPAGTKLPIALNITVPVSNTVPVDLTVPVEIPLNQTELHEPFVGLQSVLSPYKQWMASLPDSWLETQLCDRWGVKICSWIFAGQ